MKKNAKSMLRYSLLKVNAMMIQSSSWKKNSSLMYSMNKMNKKTIIRSYIQA
jgi:hypothetical protein